ncbi:Hypothetical protein AKI40_2463 [Enterobacter sp. FY-07]|uniref:PerC family transcriptional regulator n=1 Tax=Kosakonia oryzendophytica TaxID=1005665 RepID=UPI0007780544|nr:PerC family transcriptional regulator [Kosakonia oryzendophytica]AMO48861.1 Hypothetical protein AKI40_2463 [Enterobacter sp. FY-07]WBT56632.1 PerC family transcriptional regulator [Kosakonia oryzendophytica]
MTRQKRVTQIDRVAVFVAQNPGCVLGDICEAFDTPAGTTGHQLRKLVTRNLLSREHNGTQYTYAAIPGADIPDIGLGFVSEKADPKIMGAQLEEAKALELRGCWNRAATKYADMMGLARNSHEIAFLSKLRDNCFRKAQSRRVSAC